ncbi:MAG: GDSL-type esterase/lipase family protein [Chloroflexota bacterium]|nr:GDSL-type esterase/lipase family protein [Chloroflexota bacterium]
MGPDWLSVNIGINDVWRAFGGDPMAAVPLPEYEATLRELLSRARQASGARLILMEPYMIEPDRSHPMRAEMDRYRAVVRRLASEQDAVLVRTQAAFDDALAHTPPETGLGTRYTPASRDTRSSRSRFSARPASSCERPGALYATR